MSLLTLLRSAVAGSTYEGPVLDDNNDRIEDGEPFIAVQIGTRSGVPLVLPYRGTCETDFETDTITATNQIGAYSSGFLGSLPVANCTDGDLPEGEPLLGVQIGTRSGVPLIYSFCEKCKAGCCFCNSRFNPIPAIRVDLECEAAPWANYTYYFFPIYTNCRDTGYVIWQVFPQGYVGCSVDPWDGETGYDDRWTVVLFNGPWGWWSEEHGRFVYPSLIQFDPRYPGDYSEWKTTESCDPFIMAYETTFQAFTNGGGTEPENGVYTGDADIVGETVTVTITRTDP